MSKRKNGFTMMEIIIVVSIIGLLAGMGTLAIIKGMHNSRVKAAKAELEILGNSVLQLVWDTGRWPNGDWRNNVAGLRVTDLSADSAGLIAAVTNETYGEWKGPYYEDSFVDPWGDNYFFDPDYNGSPVVGSANQDVKPYPLND